MNEKEISNNKNIHCTYFWNQKKKKTGKNNKCEWIMCYRFTRDNMNREFETVIENRIGTTTRWWHKSRDEQGSKIIRHTTTNTYANEHTKHSIDNFIVLKCTTLNSCCISRLLSAGSKILKCARQWRNYFAWPQLNWQPTAMGNDVIFHCFNDEDENCKALNKWRKKVNKKEMKHT